MDPRLSATFGTTRATPLAAAPTEEQHQPGARAPGCAPARAGAVEQVEDDDDDDDDTVEEVCSHSFHSVLAISSFSLFPLSFLFRLAAWKVVWKK